MFYILEQNENTQNQRLKLFAAYAYDKEVNLQKEFELGEGLVGQCAIEKERILLSNVPENYIKISSGLGQSLSCKSDRTAGII